MILDIINCIRTNYNDKRNEQNNEEKLFSMV